MDSILWVNCVRSEDGAIDYFVAQVQDITERKRANQALRKSEEKYRSLIGQVRDFAIFSSDEYGVVNTWNEGATLERPALARHRSGTRGVAWSHRDQQVVDRCSHHLQGRAASRDPVRGPGAGV